MKATLEFNLPEEQEEYELTMRAGKMHSALHDIYLYLRQDSKYGEGKYAAVYEKFWEILKFNDVEVI